MINIATLAKKKSFSIFSRTDVSSTLVINLDRPEYLVDNRVLVIDRPTILASNCYSLILCRRILIKSDDVCLVGLRIHGSICIQNGKNVRLQDCVVRGGDTEIGAAICIENGKQIVLNQCTVTETSCPGIVMRDANTTIENCTISNMNHSLMVTSKSTVLISGSEFGESTQNGILIMDGSSLEMRNSRIHHTVFPALYVSDSSCNLTENEVHDVSQNAINLKGAKSASLVNNRIHDVICTAVHMERSINVSIIENSIRNVKGNGVSATEFSNATVYKNTITNTAFPAVAMLRESSGAVSLNTISNCEKNAITVKNTKSVVIDNNTVSNAGCGISVSDSRSCDVIANVLHDCGLSIQVVHSSNVCCEGNIVDQIQHSKSADLITEGRATMDQLEETLGQTRREHFASSAYHR